MDFICTNTMCWYSTKEVELFVEDARDKVCANCGSPSKRVFSSAIRFNLKGDGFYKGGDNQ